MGKRPQPPHPRRLRAGRDLPVVSTAMDWNPRNGPNAMIAMTLDAPSGRLVIYDYDLAADTLQHRSDLESPTGLPLSVRRGTVDVR